MIAMNPMGSIKALLSGAKGMGSRFLEAGRTVGMGRTLFQNRTALGAIGGAAYGAYSGNDYSLGRIGAYAGLGAIGAGAGGAIARGGLRGGKAYGILAARSAGNAIGRGVMAKRYIGNTLTQGFGRIKSTLGRGSMMGL